MKMRWVVVVAVVAVSLGCTAGWHLHARQFDRQMAWVDGMHRITQSHASVKVLRHLEAGESELASKRLRKMLELNIDDLYRRSDADLAFPMFGKLYGGWIMDTASYLDGHNDRLAVWARQLAARVENERGAS